MIKPTDTELYSAIGEAVVAAQVFEVCFLIVANLVLKQKDTCSISEIEPLFFSKASKQPTKAIINELKITQDIGMVLEERIVDLIERRHRLIHRQFLEANMPFGADPEVRRSYLEFAQGVSRDCYSLSISLANQILNWMSRFPEMAERAKEHQAYFEQLSTLQFKPHSPCAT